MKVIDELLNSYVQTFCKGVHKVKVRETGCIHVIYNFKSIIIFVNGYDYYVVRGKSNEL